MRRVAALAAALVTGCANIGSPPGGPIRTTPPEIVRITPDSGAVNVRARGVVFEFDAVVSDRGLDALFLISPREGTPSIRWRRSRVEVRPGDDFRPNTAYSVTMLPGVSDLNNNVRTEPRTVVFSTGPAIPSLAVLGRVFDWMNERVAPNALIEVMRLPDSLPYVGVADSAGQFSIGPLDSGTYSVRAMIDNNRNRAIDPGEPWDSAQIVVRGVSPVLELLAVPRDTFAARLLTVTAPDTLTLVASFDRPLDAGQPLATAFRVVRADSTPLRVAAVSTRAQLDSAQRAGRDTAQSDTSAVRDTTVRARPADPRVEALRARAAPPSSQVRPSRRAPPRELTIRLDSLTPMRPGASYRVTATEIRSFLGHSGTSDRVVTLPAARPDTAAAGDPPPAPRPPVRPPSR